MAHKGNSSGARIAIAAVLIIVLYSGAGCADKEGRLQRAIRNNDKGSVAHLIKDGAQVNKLKYGTAAIILAARYENSEIVEILLNNGANPNIKDKQGNTALMKAIRYGKDLAIADNNSSEVVEILLKNGANPNIQDNEGETALMKAVTLRHSKAAYILLKNGANASIKRNDGETAFTYSLTVVRKKTHDERPYYWWQETARIVLIWDKSFKEINDFGKELIIASESGFPNIIRIHIDKGLELDMRC